MKELVMLMKIRQMYFVRIDVEWRMLKFANISCLVRCLSERVQRTVWESGLLEINKIDYFIYLGQKRNIKIDFWD